MNLAIIIGVEKYSSDRFDNLVACKNDAKVINSVLNNVKDIKETLYINSNEDGYIVKRKITDFIEKYKSEEISEFFFYFSGHGERYKDDFFYILSDFDNTKREATGLRNSELDNWVKTLSPKLCVKIIDACFSGTQYIKGESNTEIEFTKSAKKYGLNDIQFWFSSRENEPSYAGSDFSDFTESFLIGITEHEGDTRYREIKDYISDDFAKKGGSKPIFITQSENIEKFGNVTKATHKIIYDAFGIEDPAIVSSNKNEQETNKQPQEKQVSVFELIKKRSNEFCFDEAILLSFIEKFNKKISEWDEDFQNIYDISINIDIESYRVPNCSQIGSWLGKNNTLNYFAEPVFDEKTYDVEEYIALPDKPKQYATPSIASFSHWMKDDTEYKLETVTKTQKYISGFNYTHSAENRILHLSFTPKVELAEPLSLFLIPIYSNRNVVIHMAYEVLKRNNWNSYSQPRCLDWKLLKVDITSSDSYDKVSNHIKSEIKKWVEEIFTKHIE